MNSDYPQFTDLLCADITVSITACGLDVYVNSILTEYISYKENPNLTLELDNGY